MLLPPFVGAINHRFKIDKLDAAGDRSAISKRRSECPNRAPFEIHPSEASEWRGNGFRSALDLPRTLLAIPLIQKRVGFAEIERLDPKRPLLTL
jgi:hypothetical protein